MLSISGNGVALIKAWKIVVDEGKELSIDVFIDTIVESMVIDFKFVITGSIIDQKWRTGAPTNLAEADDQFERLAHP